MSNANRDVAFFTTGEFAKLHHLNKRTLHYYDEIGLFSPKFKGDQDYRYYSYEQSMELEQILSLRELGMSIDEIRTYARHPSSARFHKIAEEKTAQIQASIKRLKTLQQLLRQKEEMLQLSDSVYDGKIELVELEAECLLMTPLPLVFESDANLFRHAKPVIDHLQTARELCTYKKNCGSFLSVEKIQSRMYDEYDGIFTVLDQKKKNLYTKPKGRYIRGFSIGDWNKIPSLYEQMISFAASRHLVLTGYAFETGLNEFAISQMSDYVTQIEIQCKDPHPDTDTLHSDRVL